MNKFRHGLAAVLGVSAMLAAGSYANQVACYGRTPRTSVFVSPDLCYHTCMEWYACNGERTWAGTAKTVSKKILCDKRSTPSTDQAGNIVCVGGSANLDLVTVLTCESGDAACPN